MLPDAGGRPRSYESSLRQLPEWRSTGFLTRVWCLRPFSAVSLLETVFYGPHRGTVTGCQRSLNPRRVAGGQTGADQIYGGNVWHERD